MKNKPYFKSYLKLLLVLVVGIVFGRYFFQSTGNDNISGISNSENDKIWTCSMHPQIRVNKFGKCPLCGMDLIQLEEGEKDSENLISLTSNEITKSNILVFKTKVQDDINKKITLYGKIKLDETKLASQRFHFGGRLEKIYVHFIGQKIKKGQKIANIYSPELVTNQQELLDALDNKDNDLVAIIEKRLKLKKLTQEQIDQIKYSKTIKYYFDIISEVDGVVTKKNFSMGDHFNKFDTFFDVTDLTRLWAMFEAYENDLTWLRVGDRVKINFFNSSIKPLYTKVSFIDPFIDNKRRIAFIRADISNLREIYKPEMIISGVFNIKKRISKVIIPKTSVLWTGKRSIVYIRKKNKDGKSYFEPRDVHLGAYIGDKYIVEKGLKSGEYVVVNGAFTIDAASQLQNKKSMMNNDKTATYEDISEVFRERLDDAYLDYLTWKDMLIAAKDDKLINQQRLKLINKFNKIDTDELNQIQLSDWSKIVANINKANTDKSLKLDENRRLFSTVSDNFLIIIKKYGPISTKSYLYKCPMEKGGNWLSNDTVVSNPYYGMDMLDCGSLIEQLN